MTSNEETILKALVGSGDSVTEEVLLTEELGIALEEIETVMLNHGYERCATCEMWVESHELLNEEGDVVGDCIACQY